MKPYQVIALLLVSVSATGFAQHKTKKHSELPAVFENARYVYVEAEDGDINRPGIFPEDRQAISDVEDGVRDWNRYSLTIRREQADLIIVVRKGRVVGVEGHDGVAVGTRPPGSQFPIRDPHETQAGDELGAGAEVGPSDDLLRVYTINADGKRIGPIWTREMKDGLDGPNVKLLQQLRAAVERA